ncbi:MAG TPA: glycosyltransferase [Solirubrobacteraceae bacterium]|jgi:glycosyltransferase involved in cell wall biosynthesis
MDICTIIAKNYAAQARVLARSFARHHPGGRCFVLVIDELDGYLDAETEPFEILTPAQIACDAFEEMAIRYDVLELSTAVKPRLLRYLLERDRDTITYLDPDIKVYSSLEPLDELAQEHGVVLTPHNTVPLPDDGERPTQVDIMLAGVYNLGYVSLAKGEETDRLLRWWEERLITDCVVDPLNGYFVDQRWFDLAPGFASDHAIVRDPQYNVAYWNLPARNLEWDGEHYAVDGQPLAFFHFSGFDPDAPTRLSRHQSRVSIESPALSRICNEYATDCHAAGYKSAKAWPYTYHRLPAGPVFDRTLRRLHAIAIDRGEVEGSPFSESGCGSFVTWLAEHPAGAPSSFNRLLAEMYGTRKDLQQEFPDVGGGDHKRFLQWANRHGVAEAPMLALLKRSSGEANAHRVPAPDTRATRARTDDAGSATSTGDRSISGINVAGYFRSEHGVGEAARQVVAALDAAGIAALPVHTTLTPISRQQRAFAEIDALEAPFPVNLICVNADVLPEFVRSTDAQFFADRYSIGLWFWEVSQFPSIWHSSYELVDEVWAPTAHIASALSDSASKPITTIRVPVEMPAVVPRPRSHLGLPEGFLFLFVFDYLSVFERKNPLAVIDAFTQAFGPTDGAKLVIKCINAERDPANHERLLKATAQRDDIHILERYLSSADKDSLMASCDSYVSLHRSEGFGLTMAEAMYLSKPVIATGYSGNLDFMTTSNSQLVDYELCPIGPNASPYPPEGEWAEPDVGHAARLMRQLFVDRVFAQELGASAALSIRNTHSPAAAGAVIRERLAHLPASVWTPAPPTARSSVARALAQQITQQPTPVHHGPGAPLRRAARRGVLRLVRPFAARQEQVNSDIVSAVDKLEAQVEGLRRARAPILAQLRTAERLTTLPAVVDAQVQHAEERVARVEQAATPFETSRLPYLALDGLRGRYEAITNLPATSIPVAGLGPFELRCFSQNGEDGVLLEILRRIGVGPQFFVEFGIESGREGNCVYLADIAAWNGLFIEGDATFHAELERKYRSNEKVSTQRAMVTPVNVESLFSDAGVPEEPDVLSIDVDGPDYWIWSAIHRYRPRVVIIEYNSVLDPSRRLVQPREREEPWDGTNYYGASLGAMRALGERKGYQLVHTELSAVNAFFVRSDLAANRFAESPDVTVRGAPNFFQRGYEHPPDLEGRGYDDLDDEPDGGG